MSDPVAAQYEVAIFRADILGIVLRPGPRQRLFGGRGLNLDLAGLYLNLARRQFRVHRPALTRDDLASNRDDRFGAEAVEYLKRLAPRGSDDLRQSVMIAQIDEQHPAMIALAMDPARQANRRSDG